ncbi:hypothetical protein O9K51_09513 [Purpureocillium lavendulum]|uniref:Uncharacterized protein n=1 Tax=Purpureocillium lavendulum TaxID=1247861 RepID=A0AB34FH68_9HYPO|nr:hypothetical protein O9K51_09513 [Purpureocillium lavendulum]
MSRVAGIIGLPALAHRHGDTAILHQGIRLSFDVTIVSKHPWHATPGPASEWLLGIPIYGMR